MTPPNYDSLVHYIIRFICTRLEQEIFKKKFSQYGGLQFDKERRILQNYFSSITKKTVRDKFARLSQIANLLYLEKVIPCCPDSKHFQVKEVLDFWGQNSGHMTWRLTPGEVRKVLALRVEFSKESIAQLKL